VKKRAKTSNKSSTYNQETAVLDIKSNRKKKSMPAYKQCAMGVDGKSEEKFKQSTTSKDEETKSSSYGLV
jgi:hypothetical protein